MAREDDDREVQDTTLNRGSDTHAWSAVDRPGTDPSDPRPQGPDTGGFSDVPYGTGPQIVAPNQPGDQPAQMREIGPADQGGGYGPFPGAGQPALPGLPGQNPPPPPGPVLEATGLGLLGKTGWVFQNIDLTLRPTSVAAIVGPSGTGRSSLLLALSGRLRPTAGSLSVAGHSYRDKPSSVRQLTAIARVGAVAYPEPALTVREYIAERCLLEDVNLPEGRTRFAAACDALQLQLDPSIQVGTLFGDQATLFAVAAACVRVSAVIVLDDVDRGVSAATQQLILDALIRLAMTGPTIIVTTTDRIPVMEADVVLDLTPPRGPRCGSSTGTPAARPLAGAGDRRTRTRRADLGPPVGPAGPTTSGRRPDHGAAPAGRLPGGAAGLRGLVGRCPVRSADPAIRRVETGPLMIKTVKLAGYEFRRFKGPWPVIGLLFVLLIPTVYAGLYLWSNWDPYGKRDQVPVAVVNLDQPTQVENTTISAGDRLVSELSADPIFAWQFVEQDQAEQGLADGTYYMIVEIPPDFSTNLVSGSGATPERANVNIRLNDANGYLTELLVASAQPQLQAAIDRAAIGVYLESVFANLDTIRDGVQAAAGAAGTCHRHGHCADQRHRHGHRSHHGQADSTTVVGDWRRPSRPRRRW